MRLYTVNMDLWGPLKPCNCGNKSVGIILTEEENERLPEDSGPTATHYIFANKLGTDICGECLRKNYRFTEEWKLEEIV